MIQQLVDGNAPWRLQSLDYTAARLAELLAGDSTEQRLVHLMAGRMGVGDVAILVERDYFVDKSSYTRAQVRVWTLDTALAAYG